MIVLSVNTGSSSLKVAAYDAANPTMPLASQSLEHITSFQDAITRMRHWLQHESGITTADIQAIGHRVVHGGTQYTHPTEITPEVIQNLHRIASLAPNHMPATLVVMEAFLQSYPSLPHVACFDTSFFHAIPKVAQTLPLPISLQNELDIRRFGFHGLSYQSLLASFSEHEGQEAHNGRVILAHLGSGASLAACKNGQPIDMTMGFTPVSGIMMSTRSGDIEPGVLTYLQREKGLDADGITDLVANQSGLLGVSGSSADMKQLLDTQASNDNARLAIELFCYKVAKTIGGFAAALGGIDSLIFSGGIGERSAEIRERICKDLEFLGISIDQERNTRNARLISADGMRAGVHVIPAQEDYSIITQTLAVTHRGDNERNNYHF